MKSRKSLASQITRWHLWVKNEKKKNVKLFFTESPKLFFVFFIIFFFFLQRTRLRSGSYIETKYYSNSVVVFFFCFTVCLKKYKYIILSVMNTHPFNGVENYFSIDVFFPFFFFSYRNLSRWFLHIKCIYNSV